MTDNNFDWLDGGTIEAGKTTGLESKAPTMRSGALLGKDRVWATNGQYVWFRRAKAHEATLTRHENFMRLGHYKHVETQGDVEIYELQGESPFKRQVDVRQLATFPNIRRQAAIAACKRDFQRFVDIMTYLREVIAARYQSPGRSDMSPLAANIYAEHYTATMNAIRMRNGPSPDEINREIHALNQRQAKGRLISLAS